MSVHSLTLQKVLVTNNYIYGKLPQTIGFYTRKMEFDYYGILNAEERW